MIDLKYRFKTYDWLQDMEGFGKPIDVYYGNILLGVIKSQKDGYVIEIIMGPTYTQFIKKSSNNHFKTKINAAKIMHKVWRNLRNVES